MKLKAVEKELKETIEHASTNVKKEVTDKEQINISSKDRYEMIQIGKNALGSLIWKREDKMNAQDWQAHEAWKKKRVRS